MTLIHLIFYYKFSSTTNDNNGNKKSPAIVKIKTILANFKDVGKNYSIVIS